MTKNIPIGTTITLTPKDLAYCVKIGIERWKKDKQAGLKDQMYSKNRSSIDCDISGVIGEFSLLSMCGMPTDRLNDTRPCWHSQDRGDAIGDNGWTIDIKAPVGKYCRNILIRAAKTYHPPEAYALVIIDRPREEEVRKINTQIAKEHGGLLPPNKVSFLPDETITVLFKGFASSRNILQDQNIVEYPYGKFYKYHDSKLVTWDQLVGKETTTMDQPITIDWLGDLATSLHSSMDNKNNDAETQKKKRKCDVLIEPSLASKYQCTKITVL